MGQLGNASSIIYSRLSFGQCLTCHSRIEKLKFIYFYLKKSVPQLRRKFRGKWVHRCHLWGYFWGLEDVNLLLKRPCIVERIKTWRMDLLNTKRTNSRYLKKKVNRVQCSASVWRVCLLCTIAKRSIIQVLRNIFHWNIDGTRTTFPTDACTREIAISRI